MSGLEARAEEALGLLLERRAEPEAALERYRRAEEILADRGAPARAEAVAGKARCFVALGDGREAANDWNIWLYPAVVAETVSDALVTERLDETARRRLADGGTVEVLPPFAGG